ncbi:MAG: hypothetical protein KA314_04935 [Chloroflexi bacterium]|nr:hypothetical protein [Chloroflexota bacterium]
MNPIKFRVWMSGRMLPVIKIGWGANGELGQVVGLEANEDMSEYGFWQTDPLMDSDGKDFVLMQFTGVVDKCGREIYDGDILRHDEGTPSVVGWDDTFTNSWTYTAAETYPFLYPISGGKMHGSEVIGNRYQNPELITWEIVD